VPITLPDERPREFTERSVPIPRLLMQIKAIGSAGNILLIPI